MKHGRQYRDLVLTQIRGDIEPVRENVANALRERPVKRRARVTDDGDGGLLAEFEDYAGTPLEAADSAEMIDYVVRTYVLEARPQRSGPKSPPRSLEEDLLIAAAYLDAKLELIEARDGEQDVRAIEETARRRAAEVAERPISTKTVKRVVDALRARVVADKME